MARNRIVSTNLIKTTQCQITRKSVQTFPLLYADTQIWPSYQAHTELVTRLCSVTKCYATGALKSVFKLTTSIVTHTTNRELEEPRRKRSKHCHSIQLKNIKKNCNIPLASLQKEIRLFRVILITTMTSCQPRLQILGATYHCTLSKHIIHVSVKGNPTAFEIIGPNTTHVSDHCN